MLSDSGGAGDRLLTFVSKIDREVLASDRALQKELMTFYCQSLVSRQQAREKAAFDIIMKKRTYDNDLEASFSPAARTLLKEAVARNPDWGDSDSKRPWAFNNAISLLGMCGGDEEVMTLLRSLQGNVPAFERSRQVALARLGDRAAQQTLIQQYEEETDLWEKGVLAMALGQTSADPCLKVLARDLRIDQGFPVGVGSG